VTFSEDEKGVVMADMWDIARYVEDHPENHDQRWRLAKKLYMAWEYRLALEHLQILRRVWPERLNVARYLSATYYRLGRYEEAIGELRKSLATWPEEIGIHEQLARVLEVAGRREEAADAWEELVKLSPDHPIAGRAAERLRQQPTESPREKLSLADSDSGIDLRPGRVCANCGAQNSEEFDRCWQCHAPMSEMRTPTPRPLQLSGVEEDRMALVRPAATIAILALVGLAGFLTGRDLLFARAVTTGADTFENLPEFLRVHFAVTRAIIGLVLLVGWPLAIHVALRMVGLRDVPGKRVLWTGVGVALLTSVLTWLPQPWLAAAPLAGLVAALLLLLLIVQLSFIKKVAAWAIQAVLVVLLAGAAFAALEWGLPPRELAVIRAYAASIAPDRGTYPAPAPEGGLRTPVTVPVQWPSSTSGWLDQQAKMVFVQIDSGPTVQGLTLEVRNARETLSFTDVTSGTYVLSFLVEIDQPYEIAVAGTAGQPIEFTLKGVLKPQYGTPF
jgi:tetratricopeptide (TPR) repeat protein